MSRMRLRKNSPFLVQVFRPRLEDYELNHIPDAGCYGQWADCQRWSTTASALNNVGEILVSPGNTLKARVVIDDGTGKIHVYKES